MGSINIIYWLNHDRTGYFKRSRHSYRNSTVVLCRSPSKIIKNCLDNSSPPKCPKNVFLHYVLYARIHACKIKLNLLVITQFLSFLRKGLLFFILNMIYLYFYLLIVRFLQINFDSSHYNHRLSFYLSYLDHLRLIYSIFLQYLHLHSMKNFPSEKKRINRENMSLIYKI